MLNIFIALKTTENINTVCHTSQLMKNYFILQISWTCPSFPMNCNFMKYLTQSVLVISNFSFPKRKDGEFLLSKYIGMWCYDDSLIWRFEPTILNIAWMMIVNDLSWSFWWHKFSPVQVDILCSSLAQKGKMHSPYCHYLQGGCCCSCWLGGWQTSCKKARSSE